MQSKAKQSKAKQSKAVAYMFKIRYGPLSLHNWSVPEVCPKERLQIKDASDLGPQVVLH